MNNATQKLKNTLQKKHKTPEDWLNIQNACLTLQATHIANINQTKNENLRPHSDMRYLKLCREANNLEPNIDQHIQLSEELWAELSNLHHQRPPLQQHALQWIAALQTQYDLNNKRASTFKTAYKKYALKYRIDTNHEPAQTILQQIEKAVTENKQNKQNEQQKQQQKQNEQLNPPNPKNN